MEQLNPSSVKYMTETSITHRKKYGQYMTPPVVSDLLFQHLSFTDGQTVLDPAVGTGELLLATQRQNPNLKIYGFDTDENILKIAKANLPNATLIKHDLFDPTPLQYENFFDFIIGNPPYFELKKNQFNIDEFKTAGGRTNIYSLFFERYISLLKTGGTLAYIVPPSMNAGAFFTNLRKYIIANFTIKFLKIVRQDNHFQDAQTAVQIIILTKTPDQNPKNNPYIIDFNTIAKGDNLPIIFTDNKKLIMKHWRNKKNLHEYGYKVLTGSICWNDYKTVLSPTKTLNNNILYYAKDVTNANIIKLYEALNSRRFLQTSKPAVNVDSIIVNRIVGGVNNPKVKCALIQGEVFYAENHLNVIQALTDTPKILLKEVYDRLTGFSDLSQYLQALTGNTQLSAKELNYLIPL